MAEPPAKRPRVTPRNSDVNEAVQDDTPYADLRQLASNLRATTSTPQQQRASSAGPGPTSAYRNANRTPGTTARTPRSAIRQRQFPARVGPPTTPHAIRALQARRDAALASGSRRRRSGIQARETPRDFLRALSRRLATTSQPVQPSPVPSTKPARTRSSLADDFDEGPDPGPRPRLSLPIHQDDLDDDSFHEAPPRLSLALDDMDMDAGNVTAHSVEGMRRAVSEDPMRSRLSLGRLRISERFGDLQDLDEAEEGMMYEDEGGPLIFDDPDNPLEEEITTRFGDDTTQELRAMLAARRRSRISDLGIAPRSDDLDEEPTFRFVMPQGSRDPSFVHPAMEDEMEVEEEEEDEAVEDETIRTRASRRSADAGAGAEEEQDYEDVEEEEEEEESEAEEIEAEQGITRRLLDDSGALLQQPKKRGRKKELKISRFGIEYPSLPSTTVKRIATTFARVHGGSTTKLNRETLDAVAQASEWFFEQVGEDLGAYAGHAGRKTVEETDVVALMNRQRQINASTTPFSLAQKYLPRELLQEIRMPRAAPKAKKRRKAKMETIEEGDE